MQIGIVARKIGLSVVQLLVAVEQSQAHRSRSPVVRGKRKECTRQNFQVRRLLKNRRP